MHERIQIQIQQQQ